MMKIETKFKETEIGEIPEDWDLINLEKASIMLTDGSHFSPKEARDSDSLIATVKDMEEYTINTKTCKHISKNIFDEFSKSNCRPQKGDVLFSKDGTMGLCFVFKQDDPIVILSSIALIRLNNEFDPYFIKYYLSDKKIKDFIIAGFSSGSALPRLTIVNLKQIPVVKPHIKEQSVIGSILSSLDFKIELNQQMNTVLEEIGNTIFKHWFVDFEFPNKEGKPYKSSGGEMVYNDDMDMEIPKYWNVSPLHSFGKIICGKTPPKSSKEFFNGDVPFIKIPDMHDQLFIIHTKDSLTESGRKYQYNKTLPIGSICVSCIATVGLVSITNKESHTNQQINSILPYDKDSRYYLFYTMKSLKRELNDMGSGGTATLNVNTSSFSNIKIICPERELIKKFDETVRPLFTKLLNNSIESESLSQIRDLLLPILMSGKARIPMGKN